jgi:thiol:disulfide interchange protein
MEESKKLINPVCHAPLSEPFTIYKEKYKTDNRMGGRAYGDNAEGVFSLSICVACTGKLLNLCLLMIVNVGQKWFFIIQ